jgi:uncharacterized protein
MFAILKAMFNNARMIRRTMHERIVQALSNFPVVAIVGARQTGKTTLARAIAEQHDGSLLLDLERPADLAKLSDPELFLHQYRKRLVVLDEVQRRPDLFPILRALADEGGRNGRFLVLGSASPELLRQSSESLAGRIVYFELPPFTLAEVAARRIETARIWLRGGFPRSALAPNAATSFQWREAFIATYLERDLPQLGVRVPAAQLRRFWQMLAHLHGQLWNASDVARSLGVTSPTVAHYLAILEDTFLVRRLQPYHANVAKRLVKRPRAYIRDSGLLHALLGIVDFDQLLAHPIVGASWEGFILEQVVTALPTGWRPYFYRTATGTEIDLVLVRAGAPPIAVEVNAGSAPHLEKGFRTALADLGCRRGYCVYNGADEYPLAQDVTALPATRLGRIFDSD